MKTKDFLKKYQLILVLSCMVIVLGVIKLTYKFDPNSITVQPVILTPTTTESNSVSPTEEPMAPIPDENLEKYPAWKFLPYYGQGFVVDRYVAPLSLAVKPKGLDKKLAEEEVKVWLEENGIKAEHKIQWE